ncbi:uncharacterized protein KGF55_001322 [Candida pseudojiufengensis]|uniref:uncharacterized protein n=1 Tax=Candida pseudojiufengensis TaxID=497109 RepID=UPI0022246CF0|nr:uncharacterized protein KGF55_001322 [Candida pseudojiufengensis]KAI5965958.1 hypothetical protein KGF55_001322 [Candida pseudojiufengensis]
MGRPRKATSTSTSTQKSKSPPKSQLQNQSKFRLQTTTQTQTQTQAKPQSNSQIVSSLPSSSSSVRITKTISKVQQDKNLINETNKEKLIKNLDEILNEKVNNHNKGDNNKSPTTINILSNSKGSNIAQPQVNEQTKLIKENIPNLSNSNGNNNNTTSIPVSNNINNSQSIRNLNNINNLNQISTQIDSKLIKLSNLYKNKSKKYNYLLNLSNLTNKKFKILKSVSQQLSNKNYNFETIMKILIKLNEILFPLDLQQHEINCKIQSFNNQQQQKNGNTKEEIDDDDDEFNLIYNEIKSLHLKFEGFEGLIKYSMNNVQVVNNGGDSGKGDISTDSTIVNFDNTESSIDVPLQKCANGYNLNNNKGESNSGNHGEMNKNDETELYTDEEDGITIIKSHYMLNHGKGRRVMTNGSDVNLNEINLRGGTNNINSNVTNNGDGNGNKNGVVKNGNVKHK